MAPDAAALPIQIGEEPIIGWRLWHVLPGERRLRPIFKRGLVWKPREAQEAVCPEESHDVPDEKCRCGVYTVCHAMLLQEVHWDRHPPKGVPPLPGVIVVGQVALWGRIIQHERGWRSQFAYPSHLYVFSEDADLAAGLRDEYLVPVTHGADADRLRRLLPASDEAEVAPPTPAQTAAWLLEALSEMSCTAFLPVGVRQLVEAALALPDSWKIPPPPRERGAAAREALRKTDGETVDRGPRRRELLLAWGEERALAGLPLPAIRTTWIHMARWQRARVQTVVDYLEALRRQLVEATEDIARGTGRRDGQPYAETTLYQKRCQVRSNPAAIDETEARLRDYAKTLVPSYREWRALVRSAGSPAPSRSTHTASTVPVEWYRQAIEQEGRIATALAAFRKARAALAEQQGALKQEVANAKEKCAALHKEASDLRESVRRLKAEQSAVTHAGGIPTPVLNPAGAAMKKLLREARIPQSAVAEAAGVTRQAVCHVLAGRAVSARVLDTARRLLDERSHREK
jgi:hypothetical protein